MFSGRPFRHGENLIVTIFECYKCDGCQTLYDTSTLPVPTFLSGLDLTLKLQGCLKSESAPDPV